LTQNYNEGKTTTNLRILLQFEGLEIDILALIWDRNPGVQGARLFSRLRVRNYIRT